MAQAVVKSRRRKARADQQGAALVLVIAIAGVAVMAWQQRASLSQLLMAQHVLEQSTAAASLAAAQHHARLFNAHAYLNRTVMAHQVAMAHLMTIASAEKMRYEMSRRLIRGNPPLYLIGMMFGPHHAAAYAASRVSVAGTTLNGVRELHEAFKQHDRILSQDLARARQSLLDGIESETYAIVRAVLDKNLTKSGNRHARFDVDVDIPVRNLQPMLVEPTERVWRLWFRQTLDRHEYLSKRRDTARNWWVISQECPHMRHELRRRGESSFEVNGLWQVTDTLSFHAVRGAKVILCFWREYPMGFSNIKSNARGKREISESDRFYSRPGSAPDDFRKMTFLKWFTSQFAITALLHGFANGLADGWGYKTQLRWATHAKASPYVLRSVKSLTTRVRVRQPLDSLKDPVLRIGLRVAGLLQIEPDWGKRLESVSFAQVYFDRYEARSDRRRESANLFQPFWMARNVLEP